MRPRQLLPQLGARTYAPFGWLLTLAEWSVSYQAPAIWHIGLESCVIIIINHKNLEGSRPVCQHWHIGTGSPSERGLIRQPTWEDGAHFMRSLPLATSGRQALPASRQKTESAMTLGKHELKNVENLMTRTRELARTLTRARLTVRQSPPKCMRSGFETGPFCQV